MCRRSLWPLVTSECFIPIGLQQGEQPRRHVVICEGSSVNGALLLMPKSVPSPNNLHAPDAETNTIVPGNIDTFLHLSTAWSLFSFSECDFRIKQEMILL